MDILTSPTHPTTTKQPDTPATAPPSDMSANNDTDNQSTASDAEYETAFDKLQRLQSRLANPDDAGDDNAVIQKSSGKKRRGKGYGVSSLEALPTDDNGDEMTDDIDISTFANDDFANRKSMFDDDLSNGNLSDGDMLEEDESSAVAEPKGRSRNKSMLQDDDESVASKQASEDAAMDSDEEMDVGQTEASGYRFSQGAVRADNEEERSIGGDEQEFESVQPDTQTDAMDEVVELESLVAAPEEETTQDPQLPTPPTETELYTVVDSIYQSADKNTMTVKQVNKSVAAHFKMDKVDKEMKGLIKDRLTKLVSGQIKVGSAATKKSTKEKKPKKEKKAVEPEEEFEGDVESEEEVNYDSSSDYDEAPAKKSRKPRKKYTSDDASLSDDSIASDKPRRSRKRRSSTGKMAKHLREHATKLRERQLEESRIRQEELGNIAAKAEEGPKLSEEDRARAQAIAARFDTNREEELVKREEDRAGLIDVLRRKRLEIITLDDEKVQDVAETKETVKSEVMIDLEDDEEESSDEELQLVAPVKKLSAMDCLMAKPGDIPAPILRATKPKPAANSRLALRNALRAKQVKAGNRWLARELGYKTEEDHIKECMDAELKKRKQIVLLEKQAALGVKKELGASNPAFDVPAEDPDEPSGDEEDEEIAMAKQLDLEVKSEAGDDADEEEMLDAGDGGFEAEENAEQSGEPKFTAETSSPASSPTKTVTSIVSPSGSREASLVSTETTEAEVHDDIIENEKVDNADEPTESEPGETHADESNDNNANDPNANEAEADATETGESYAEETETKSNKPKNSAWKEMLRKEKEMLAKEKKRKGGGLVEGEAEEEEEEEGIVGLEDFGFSVEKKKDDDADEEDAEADEDDLEHVVDDLSDGEGDEEAGEQARKKLEAREEKERHKEIMRRMREGYDGRRGGIASGAGARGIHRFDQLVAADNREDAKRLGLLNEDEMDSDDENENGEAKETKDAADEDEAVLLDKMLKERFLNRDVEDAFEENFSDSEEEDIDEEHANGDNPEDDEEKEQDRLAKQFAKRARMNRILEAYEGDTEFSRSRLIDEDASMHIELKTMKTTQAKKRGSIFTEASNLGSGLFKRQKSDSNIGSQQSEKSFKPATTFTSQEGSLSVALLASRSTGQKRKTTFLSGRQSTSFSRQNSSNKSVSLSHVVFVTGESQGASQLSRSASNLGKSSASKKPTTKFSASSSLWNRAISKNWSK